VVSSTERIPDHPWLPGRNRNQGHRESILSAGPDLSKMWKYNNSLSYLKN
jgi:hypothetical protein